MDVVQSSLKILKIKLIAIVDVCNFTFELTQ